MNINELSTNNQPKVAMPKIDWDFLAWIERAMMFPGDMFKEMQEAGLTDYEAYTFSASEAVRKHHSVVRMFQDYGSDGELRIAFEKWINWCYSKYRGIKN